MELKTRLSVAKKKVLQRSVLAALSFSNILRLNLYFPWWGWGWVWMGGWVGQIKIKDHLSTAEAETGTELGNKIIKFSY